MRAISPPLALTLLVTGVLADHQDRAVAADDLALFAHRLYGSSNLHCSGLCIEHRTPASPRSWAAGTTIGPLGPTGKDSRGIASGRDGEGRGAHPKTRGRSRA